MNDRPNKTVVIVTLDEITVALATDGSLALHFDLGASPTLRGGLDLAVRLSPDEARSLAATLQRKADEAERQSRRD
jgi:hypothetical protein